jgi:hypothetical protein
MLQRFRTLPRQGRCRAEEQAADAIEPRIVSSAMAFVGERLRPKPV